MLRKPAKKIGDQAEDYACDYLQKKNIAILQRNFRFKTGEIDIIAKDKNTILFIEVKFRKSIHFGEPFEFVTPQKQHKIIQTAQLYLQKNNKLADHDCRFDVISIHNDKLTWLKNAFELT